MSPRSAPDVRGATRGSACGPRVAAALLVLLALLALQPGAAASQGEGATYFDSTAARLHAAAVAHRERVDDQVLEYTA